VSPLQSVCFRLHFQLQIVEPSATSYHSHATIGRNANGLFDLPPLRPFSQFLQPNVMLTFRFCYLGGTAVDSPLSTKDRISSSLNMSARRNLFWLDFGAERSHERPQNTFLASCFMLSHRIWYWHSISVKFDHVCLCAAPVLNSSPCCCRIGPSVSETRARDLQNIFEYDVLVFLQEMVCNVGVMFHVLLNPVDTILIPECIHPHRSFTFEPCQQGEYRNKFICARAQCWQASQHCYNRSLPFELRSGKMHLFTPFVWPTIQFWLSRFGLYWPVDGSLFLCPPFCIRSWFN
jgi:hypothetical protein